MKKTAKPNTSLISTEMTEEDVSIVSGCIKHIRQTKKSIVLNILDMGKYLSAARDAIDKYGSKAFNQFLNSDDVQIDRRRAEAYMYAYDRFADLPTALTGQFTGKAIYLLSAPSAPEDAADAAIEKAKQGVRVTEKAAKGIVIELTPSDDSEPDDDDPEPWNEPADDEQDRTTGDEQEDAEPNVDQEKLAPGAKSQTRVSGEPAPPVDPEPASEPATEIRDEAGHRIGHLESVANVFRIVRADWDRMMGAAKIASDVAEELVSHPVGEGLKRTGVDAELRRLVQKISQLRPHAVCPQCEGSGGCVQCSSRGWVNSTAYMQSYSDSQRDALAKKLGGK